MAISDGEATSTKSYERLMAEKESLRKSLQESQRKIDELESVRGNGNAPKEEAKPWFANKDELSSVVEETVHKANNRWWEARMDEEKKRQEEAANLQSQFLGWRKKAHEEFEGAKDNASELSKLAQEIFNDPKNDLSDGKGGPTRLSSEYDAYARAQVMLQKKNAVKTEANTGLNFAATGGQGASGAPGAPRGIKEMPDSEWMKLSKDERDRLERDEFEKENQRLLSLK